MRRHQRISCACALLALVALLIPAVARAATPVIPGSRSVDVRNTDGSISRYTTIPSTSLFTTYGGRGAPCTFARGSQLVRSYRWIFVEGLPAAVGEPNPTDPTVNRGPLAGAVRWFTVFCDSLDHAVGLVAVPSRDPMLDPRTRLVSLYNGLQLVRPTVFRNPVVDRWGGLITRYQAWLAIQPPAWKAQRSNAATWRGWTMYLLTRPAALEFQVDFTPSASRPSPAFHGVVACVPMNTTPVASGTALPAMPVLPIQSSPGVNGACRWTPPGPGSVTVQARLVLHVTFWANGYTETLADYVWTGAPATFRTGELAAVNTNG
jgi:hypothetical protein